MSVLVVVTLLKMFMDVWNGPPASLGELALREAVRRQAAVASQRAVTNADLAPAPPRPSPPATAGAAADEKKADEKTTSDKAAEPVKDEAWWRARMTVARAALERDKLLLAALDSRVKALTRDSTNRDDPAQRAALLAERLRALEELDLMTKQVAADAAAIAAIEEEARQAGIPPGWIRLF